MWNFYKNIGNMVGCHQCLDFKVFGQLMKDFRYLHRNDFLKRGNIHNVTKDALSSIGSQIINSNLFVWVCAMLIVSIFQAFSLIQAFIEHRSKIVLRWKNQHLNAFLIIIISYLIYGNCSNVESHMGKRNVGNLGSTRQNFCLEERIDQGRAFYNCNVSIINCFFSRISTLSGSGGVIYISGGTYTLIVSESMFYGCSCSDEGGALYFSSFNAFLNKICANNCSVTTYYHFAYIHSTKTIYVDYLSVSLCSYKYIGYYPIYLRGGKQDFQISNSSLNSVDQVSGVCFSQTSSFNSSFCTISNNNAKWLCIWFYYSTGKVEFFNLVHNKASHHLFFESGTYILNYCVIHSNTNELYHSSSGAIFIISNSFIHHSGGSSFGSNNSITLSHTYQVGYYGSYYCKADGFQSLNPTPEKTFIQTNDVSIEETFIKTKELTIEETLLFTPFISPISTPFVTMDCTIQMTPILTPYRSYGEMSPINSNHPERTEHRTFPIDIFERTPIHSNEITYNNNINNQTYTALISSTIILSILIIGVIIYLICQRRRIGTSESSICTKHENKLSKEKQDT